MVPADGDARAGTGLNKGVSGALGSTSNLSCPRCAPSVSGSSMCSGSSCSFKNLLEFFGVCVTCLSFIHVKSFLENLKRLIRDLYVCARKSPAFMIE